MSQYSSIRVYEEAYNIELNYEKWLPGRVFHFHDLIRREINAPVSLQMGVLLPFVSSICGPMAKGFFMTRPSVLNLFWINVAASGVGKSQSRKRMITEPLKYLIENSNKGAKNFEVSRFTHAGMCWNHLI